ncbi:TRAP transporter small permease [Vibrio astriarenae]
MKFSRLPKELVSAALAALTTVMTLLVFIAVVYRYGFNKPLLFSFEVTTALFVWIVFLGMAHTYLKGGHLGLDVIDNYLSPKQLSFVKTLRSLIVAGISSYISWISWPVAMGTRLQLNSVGISAKYLYFAVPIGFGLLAFVIVVQLLYQLVKGKKSTSLTKQSGANL